MTILPWKNGGLMVDVYVTSSESPTSKATRVRRVVKSGDRAQAAKLHAEIEAALRKVGMWEDGRKPGPEAHQDPIEAAAREAAPDTGPSRNLKDAIMLAWDDPEAGWSKQRGGRKQFANAWDVITHIGPSRKCNSINRDTYNEIRLHLDGKGNSPATITRKLQAFHRVLHFAELRGWITGRVKWKRSEARRREFTFSDPKLRREIIRYFRVTGERDMRHLFLLGCETGMRQGELLALEPAHCKFREGLVRLTEDMTKNGTGKSVVLTPSAQAILRLRARLHPKGKLFPAMTVDRLGDLMGRVREATGYEDERDFVFHATRHTHGTRLAENEVSLQDIMGQLGHKTAKMSLHYIHQAAISRRSNILRRLGHGN